MSGYVEISVAGGDPIVITDAFTEDEFNQIELTSIDRELIIVRLRAIANELESRRYGPWVRAREHKSYPGYKRRGVDPYQGYTRGLDGTLANIDGDTEGEDDRE